MERVLLDSNIIIYAAQPQHQALVAYLREFEVCYAKISQIEVLGYHLLKTGDRKLFEVFFSHATGFALSEAVVMEAISMKQQQKMSLGDALIAATASVHGLRLFTRNVRDFDHLIGLQVVDPFDSM